MARVGNQRNNPEQDVRRSSRIAKRDADAAAANGPAASTRSRAVPTAPAAKRRAAPAARAAQVAAAAPAAPAARNAGRRSVANAPPAAKRLKVVKKEEPPEVDEAEVRRQAELAEQQRRAAEAERERVRREAQAAWDVRTAGFLARYDALGPVPQAATPQENDARLATVSPIYHEMLRAISAAPREIDFSTAQLIFNEVRVEWYRLRDEVFAYQERVQAEREERERVAQVERDRKAREEARKVMEEREKKEKEEEQRRRTLEEEEIRTLNEKERLEKEEERRAERIEKERMEASMLEKECRICFDEVKDGVGCMECMNVIGCKPCVREWLETSKTCPFCRVNFTSVSKQVRPVSAMKNAKKRASQPGPEKRRSSRIQQSAAPAAAAPAEPATPAAAARLMLAAIAAQHPAQ